MFKHVLGCYEICYGISLDPKTIRWESKRAKNLSIHDFFNPLSPGVFRRDIFLGGGLKDPQPSTGLTPIRFLRKLHHWIKSLS